MMPCGWGCSAALLSEWPAGARLKRPVVLGISSYPLRRRAYRHIRST